MSFRARLAARPMSGRESTRVPSRSKMAALYMVVVVCGSGSGSG